MKNSLYFLIVLCVCLSCVVQAQQLESSDRMDEFTDESNCFPDVNEKYGVSHCKKGAFHTTYFDTSGTWSQTEDYQFDLNADIKIRTSIIQTKNKSTDGFGLVYGRRDYDNTNYFLISSSGYFIVYSYENKVKKMLCDWKYESSINGPGKTNTLEIERSGAVFLYKINGITVFTCPSEKIKLYKSKIGFQMNGAMTLDAGYLFVSGWRKKINLVSNSNEFGVKELLSDSINSACHEKHPIISPDGNFLFINREGHPLNAGSNHKEDIWMSELGPGNVWGKLKNIGTPLNNNSHNAISGISADNNFVLIGGVYSDDMTSSASGYSFSQKTKTGWSKPVKLDIEDYYNNNEYASATLSSDAKTIILSAERKEGSGESDLYVIFKNEKGGWTKPLSLGETINTDRQDYAPYLAADGVTLYFSSYGHPGYGSADLFVSKRLDDTWTKWSEPQNLGPHFNSKEWDAYLSIPAEGMYAYFVSTNAKNKLDVYRMALPASAAPEKRNMVHGKVVNVVTDSILRATIRISETATGKEIASFESSEGTGEYAYVLKGRGRVTITCSIKGFYSVSKTVEMDETGRYINANVDFFLVPDNSGKPFFLKKLQFKEASDTVSEKGNALLSDIAALLNQNKNVKMSMNIYVGFPHEKSGNNLALSEKRALAAKKTLLSLGVGEAQILVSGKGDLLSAVADSAVPPAEAVDVFFTEK